jgi:Fis family transcriptional regulator
MSHHKSDARTEAAVRDNELSLVVRKVMKQYFKDLDGEKTSGIYSMVVGCVEKPLLEVVMSHAHGNQTRAAEILGLNRNTLRKKLQQHGIDQ